MQDKLARIEQKIAGIKAELQKIGKMRPGSLTYQYQKPKEKKGGFWQISYTYQMKSRTEYVRPEFVQDLKKQIAMFKRFKKLIQLWTDLAIKSSQEKIKLAKLWRSLKLDPLCSLTFPLSLPRVYARGHVFGIPRWRN
jgi:hypothetical protein